MESEPGKNVELGETQAQTGQFRKQLLFMPTLSVTLSDSVWAEAFPGTVSTINQDSQPEYRSQYLLTRMLVLHRPTQEGLFKGGREHHILS